jgi:hypothetical protein
MDGALMLVVLMLGGKFIVPTTIKSVEAGFFVYPVFGVPQKTQGIMENKFAE